MKFFTYDKNNGNLALEDESVLLIKELADLLEAKRNITKTDKTGKTKSKAFRELTYIYLFFDWASPYFVTPEQERHRDSLLDSGLTPEEFNDPLFRAACRRYDEIQNMSLEIRMLKAAMSAIESQIYYLQHVDLQERDPVSGKPIFKSKDLIAEIKGCKDVITGLRELEKQVKTGFDTQSNLRGNTELGALD
jgi:hypothetical protein